jgi:hypothetical protein
MRTNIYWLFNSIRSKFESEKAKYERERTNAQYLLISPTNCGRTWLRFLLGKSFQLHFNFPENLKLFYLYGFSEMSPVIPSIKCSHEKYRGYSYYRYRRIIFLVRDPRDAVVSKYFWSYKKRLKKQNTEDQLELFDYINKKALDYYISFYNEWIQHQSEMMGFLVVRYEDLRQNTFAELQRIINFLGLKIPDEIISTSIEYASFNNMRKMEAQKQSKALKPTDPQNTKLYKTRKGKVGGFQEELSRKEIAFIEKEINERLDPSLGYNYYSDPL